MKRNHLHPAMIRHTVVFRLKHPAGSAPELDFLRAACALAGIPGVQHFECLRQVSSKNPFTFGLSMEFADAEAYQLYSDHPDHARFVQERWLPEVAEFMEIDYIAHEVAAAHGLRHIISSDQHHACEWQTRHGAHEHRNVGLEDEILQTIDPRQDPNPIRGS